MLTKGHDELDKELENFILNCESKFSAFEVQQILAPLRWKLRIQFWKPICLVSVLFLLSALAIYYVPLLNWNASAIGRILMVKSLVIWDWTVLKSQKCLIPKWTSSVVTPSSSASVRTPKLTNADCVVCENYANIEVVATQTYDQIYDRFLIRGIPVIIEDSHPIWKSDNFTEYIFTIDRLIASNPCEIQSNLIFGKYSNLEELLELSLRTGKDEGWFLHFQNCDFSAVKASRLIVERPKYLSFHLDPFQSSWILMSHFYPGQWKPLFVRGLILIMQLKGDGEFLLESKPPCNNYCSDHQVVIHEGEALGFVTDLWELFYRPSSIDMSITFVTETDWNP